MAQQYVWVTGKLNLSPETVERNEAVLQAFQGACKMGPSTIYVLGNMFAPETSRDAMDRYLKGLPGRLVLVANEATLRGEEGQLSGWHEVVSYRLLELWGKKFLLWPESAHSPVYDAQERLLVHVDDTMEDAGLYINASWDASMGDLAAGGLKNLYALSVMAEQIGAGMVAQEPADGR